MLDDGDKSQALTGHLLQTQKANDAPSLRLRRFVNFSKNALTAVTYKTLGICLIAYDRLYDAS
jgi:hypothetical protein